MAEGPFNEFIPDFKDVIVNDEFISNFKDLSELQKYHLSFELESLKDPKIFSFFLYVFNNDTETRKYLLKEITFDGINSASFENPEDLIPNSLFFTNYFKSNSEITENFKNLYNHFWNLIHDNLKFEDFLQLPQVVHNFCLYSEHLSSDHLDQLCNMLPEIYNSSDDKLKSMLALASINNFPKIIINDSELFYKAGLAAQDEQINDIRNIIFNNIHTIQQYEHLTESALEFICHDIFSQSKYFTNYLLISNAAKDGINANFLTGLFWRIVFHTDETSTLNSINILNIFLSSSFSHILLGPNQDDEQIVKLFYIYIEKDISVFEFAPLSTWIISCQQNPLYVLIENNIEILKDLAKCFNNEFPTNMLYNLFYLSQE